MKKDKLLAMAKAAHYPWQDHEGYTSIREPGPDGIRVRIYDDGTIRRSDVDPSIALNMTVAECADALGLLDWVPIPAAQHA